MQLNYSGVDSLVFFTDGHKPNADVIVLMAEPKLRLSLTLPSFTALKCRTWNIEQRHLERSTQSTRNGRNMELGATIKM